MRNNMRSSIYASNTIYLYNSVNLPRHLLHSTIHLLRGGDGLGVVYTLHSNGDNCPSASIGGASLWWMYPDSKQSQAKSPTPILQLLAIRPGAAHPGGCFGTPGYKAIYCP